MKLFRTTDDATAEDETAPDEKGDPAMSPYPTAQADDDQPAAAGQPRPTFTPAGPAADGTPDTAGPAAAGPAVSPPATTITRTGTASAQETSFADDAPVRDEASAVDAVDTDEPPAPLPVDEPAAAFMADEPLLANTTGMRASWQKVQAGFVDDPRAAVMDAADLIEQTAQSLVDALQQRQRQLRVLSDGGGATAGDGTGSAAANGVPDTEHLRLMMQRYRTLFDQLCSA